MHFLLSFFVFSVSPPLQLKTKLYSCTHYGVASVRHYRWDMLTSDLELVESIDAHYDVVYGTYDPKYFTW